MAEGEKKISILVIEDDSFLQRAYQAKFKKEGFETFTAGDGELGLKMARENKPDVILLDLMLPKVSGFDILQILKNDPTTASIPVIILSNLGQETDRKKGKLLGAAEYLVKANISLDEIVKKIKFYVDGGI